ncbi:MAG: sialidase family protein [Anaerolineaceae bacterium]|nr:sialidase family protein [Anaerolineaceae bacterium]
MYIAPRSVDHKVFEIWRNPGRFTKNPDLISLPSGRLMLIYADTDAHWSMKNQVLTLLASDDDGRTWFKYREIDEADLTRGDERLVTPRLSILKDGRLVVICDHDDDGHFHEEQPPGNWLYWSEDQGDTWRAQRENGIGGFEPDRILDLPDGSLGVVSHLMRGEYQEFAEVLWVSTDGGATWKERATVACDGYHRFCEGAIVLLHGGRRLACVLRENHSGGIPSFVTFSDDNGHNWSAPQKLPFALHRPYAKQLADGRVLVSGRNVNGGLGTYAWVGDLEAAAGQHVIGGPRRKYSARMEDEALVIENGPEQECRYSLPPPQSSFSEVDFEAELRVEASGDADVAFLSISRLGVLVTVTPDSIRMQRGRHHLRHPADMRQWRRLHLHHRRGWFRVMLDDEVVFHRSIYREEWPASDFHGGNPLTRTQFGQYGDSGRSLWRSIHYRLGNPSLEDHEWLWVAADGQLPDQAQRDHLIQIHANHPAQQPMPDHGYSSWFQREDGGIILVDYTNCGDVPNTSHLVGVYLEPEDLA